MARTQFRIGKRKITVTHEPADQRKAGQAIKHLKTASPRLSKSALDKAIARLQGKFARKSGHALTPETARKGGLARARSITPKQQKLYSARLGLNVQELDSFVRFLHLRSDSDGSCCQQLPAESWEACERSVVQEFHFCNVERQLMLATDGCANNWKAQARKSQWPLAWSGLFCPRALYHEASTVQGLGGFRDFEAPA